MRFLAAEYLTFITAIGKSDVNAIYFDKNVWLSQNRMELLCNVETDTIKYHLKTVFVDGKGYHTNHYNTIPIPDYVLEASEFFV